MSNILSYLCYFYIVVSNILSYLCYFYIVMSNILSYLCYFYIVMSNILSYLCYLCLFLYSDVQHFVLFMLFMLFLYSGVQHFVLLYVFTFLVLCCPVLLRFLHKTISCSSLPSIGCRRAGALFMLFVFISYSVSHVLDI